MHESNIFMFKKHAIPTNGNEKPPKPPVPFWAHGHHQIHPSLNRPHSPFQMASKSNQPFRHNTLSGQTGTQMHSQTYIWDRRQVSKKSAYVLIYW